MEAVDTTVARMRLIVLALTAGVLALATASGFIELGVLEFARVAGMLAGLAGLVVLPAAWRVYLAMREGSSDVADVQTGCNRYSSAVLMALAMSEGVAFIGIVFYLMGAEIVSMLGVVTHVLLTGVLWPTAEKVHPFLGRAGGGR